MHYFDWVYRPSKKTTLQQSINIALFLSFSYIFFLFSPFFPFLFFSSFPLLFFFYPPHRPSVLPQSPPYVSLLPLSHPASPADFLPWVFVLASSHRTRSSKLATHARQQQALGEAGAPPKGAGRSSTLPAPPVTVRRCWAVAAHEPRRRLRDNERK